MNKFIKKVITCAVFAVIALSVSFIQSGNTTCGQVSAATFEWGTVNISTVKLRRSPTTASYVVKTIKKGTRVKCLNLKTTWIKVSYGNYTGYIEGKYLNTAYGTASQPYKNVRQGIVNNSSLTIRATSSSSSIILKTLKQGNTILVLSPGSEFVKVKYGTIIGYARGEDISFHDGGTAAKPDVTKGQQVVEYAKKFLGNPYVWGGTDLIHGTDCSGFTLRVFQHFGYKLPRTSAEQRSAGRKLNSLREARAGDIVCYYGHVAIYMGNNKIIHASNRRDGIKISYNAAYRPIASIRRIIK